MTKIFTILIIISNFIHAGYNDDLGDATLPFYSHVETIGNLGEIKSIIDLRGFVPVRLLSVENDDLEWYKVPIEEFINAIYFKNEVSWLSKLNKDEDKGFLKKWGDKISNSVAKAKNKYLNIPDPIKENNIDKEEEQIWVKYAYDLSQKGKELYESIGAGYGYDNAEAIMILETENSGLVFINFKYQGPITEGQYLVAFELSKNGNYKTFYRVYDTAVTSVNTDMAFKNSTPIILDIVLKIGTISKIVKGGYKIYKSY